MKFKSEISHEEGKLAFLFVYTGCHRKKNLGLSGWVINIEMRGVRQRSQFSKV